MLIFACKELTGRKHYLTHNLPFIIFIKDRNTSVHFEILMDCGAGEKPAPCRTKLDGNLMCSQRSQNLKKHVKCQLLNYTTIVAFILCS